LRVEISRRDLVRSGAAAANLMNDRRLELPRPIASPFMKTPALFVSRVTAETDSYGDEQSRKGEFGIPRNMLDVHQFISFY
jgi:hypothetical protein